MFLPNVVRFIPPAWFLTLVLLALGGWVLAAPSATPSWNTLRIPALCLAGLIVIRVVAFFIARQQAAPTAKTVAADLAKARRLHDACYHKADFRLQQDQERIKTEFQNRTKAIDQEYKDVIKEAIGLRDLRPRQIDEKAGRINQKAEKVRIAHTERLELHRTEALPNLKLGLEGQTKQLSETQA